jgi:hypothetical protein
MAARLRRPGNDVAPHQNLAAARALLKQYLSATVTPDDPPRAGAEKLLREIGG